MNDITPKEAIANLNHLYGMVAPDIQRSLDVVIKAVERPSGDCISRSDLKKKFDKECQNDCSVCEHSRFDSFKGYYHCGLIDNAQTIPLPNEQTAWEQGYEAGLAQGKAETRPQGEWARHDEWRGGEYIGGFYHVNCPCEDGHFVKWRMKYCGNCGAPMQLKDKEEGGAE